MAWLSDIIPRAQLEDGWGVGLAVSAISIITFLLVQVATQVSQESRFWNSQPWSGPKSEVFAGTRAYFRSFFAIREMLDKGYHNVRTSKLPMSTFHDRLTRQVQHKVFKVQASLCSTYVWWQTMACPSARICKRSYLETRLGVELRRHSH